MTDILNPLDVKNDDDYSWLELPNIPEQVINPFDFSLDGQILDPIDDMMQILMNKDYLHFAVKTLLNVDLLPYQLVILDTLWNKRLPMLIASRGGSKSFMMSVYALLRMIFHPRCKIVIVGAAFRQSRQLHDYMTTIWENSAILRDIAGKGGGPKREVDRCEFWIGDSVTYAIPLGTGEKIRGLRANYILVDEFASVPESVFNLVVQGFAVVSSSPVEKVRQAAVVKKLKELGEWSDELEALRQNASGGNQIVYSGTAFYSFNHFYKYFKKWHAIISTKGDPEKIKDFMGENDASMEGFNWKDYAILRIPYTCLPEGYLDAGIVSQAKATLNKSQFLMEYGCIFMADSDGFFRRSIIENATTTTPILVPSGRSVQFSALRYGDKDKVYVMAIDPAADQDNAAIVVLEIYQDHRRVVNCWSTNRKKFNNYKKNLPKGSKELEDDYYRHIAKKIRSLMRVFNIERIIMDKNGGGIALEEMLSNQSICEDGEFPVYPIIDTEEPKPTDMHEGLHILELIKPNMDINSEANHGMLKDLQEKVLLFPMFDTVEMEKAIQLDKINNIKYDTYEDLVQEIEELKTEMTTIVVTPSSVLGKETFDTPQIKIEGSKKGRLKKDRYSALLYANFYARSKGKNEMPKLEYRAVGGSKDMARTTIVKSSTMYSGPGILKFGHSKWMNGQLQGYYKGRERKE